MMRIRDGKLSEWWITWDNMTILAQLGPVHRQDPGYARGGLL
jgi:hypothetical protein